LGVPLVEGGILREIGLQIRKIIIIIIIIAEIVGA
jgi:hypothetical protein